MPVTTPGDKAKDPAIGSWFYVSLDNGIEGLFKDAGGISVEVEVTDFNESDAKGNVITLKRPGKVKYGEITLKRNMTSDKAFYEWAKAIRDGKAGKDFRHNGEITVTTTDGTKIAGWKFENAWPSKWAVSDLEAGSTDALTEDITLQIELLERTA